MTEPTSTTHSSTSASRSRAQHHPKHWWLEHYQAWQRSGQSKSDYCATHDIKLSSFYNWVCRFQKESVASSSSKPNKAVSPFVEMAILPSSSAQARSLTIGDITVGFDEGLSPADIVQWIKPLRAISC